VTATLDRQQSSKQPPPPRRSPPGRGFWVVVALLALLDALMVYAAIVLFADEAWLMLLGLVVGGLVVNWVYLSPRTRALRWVTPGLVMMVLFMIIPIIFNAFVSLTNWSTGNALSKDQAIERIESETYVDPSGQGQVYDLSVYQDDASGELRFLLVGESGDYIFAEARGRDDPPVEDAVEEEGTFQESDEVPPTTIGAYRLLNFAEIIQLTAQVDFEQLTIDIPDGEVTFIGTDAARVFQASQRYVYDEERDVMLDTVTDEVCVVGTEVDLPGNFVCPGDRMIEPGWRAVIGFENYTEIVSNERIREPFFGVFAWNVVFAALSVAFTFTLGLALAVVMNHHRLGGRTIYRSIFIIPYAIPGFLSILIWRGLLNADFGTVNEMLAPLYNLLGMDPIPWLLDPFWARFSVLFVNLWLGFPYMFLICLGALQAIPGELLEAARVDGASGWRVFRKITFPLLMVSLAPLLIGSFAFNFNNFVLIFLLTNGGPPYLDASVPVGATDILISFTFNVAVQAGRGANFGIGAAISIFIFFIVASISAFSFRFTKRLEEIYGSL
jgi:arabinogalactan oligomer / maltooligosaccharide transport system permease protein